MTKATSLTHPFNWSPTLVAYFTLISYYLYHTASCGLQCSHNSSCWAHYIHNSKATTSYNLGFRLLSPSPSRHSPSRRAGCCPFRVLPTRAVWTPRPALGLTCISRRQHRQPRPGG
ncbi:hypothetical protein XPA_003297 [Xanthoria parietina]